MLFSEELCATLHVPAEVGTNIIYLYMAVYTRTEYSQIMFGGDIATDPSTFALVSINILWELNLNKLCKSNCAWLLLPPHTTSTILRHCRTFLQRVLLTPSRSIPYRPLAPRAQCSISSRGKSAS